MTQLRHVTPIKEYVSRYNLTAMVETGTEGGDSIATGQKLHLSPIVSCCDCAARDHGPVHADGR